MLKLSSECDTVEIYNTITEDLFLAAWYVITQIVFCRYDVDSPNGRLDKQVWLSPVLTILI